MTWTGKFSFLLPRKQPFLSMILSKALCLTQAQCHISYVCCCLATKSCQALWDPMDSNPPGSSVHEISQARILEWVAISFSSGSSAPRDQTCISCIGRQTLYHWDPWKALFYMDIKTSVSNPLNQSNIFQDHNSICSEVYCSDLILPLFLTWHHARNDLFSNQFLYLDFIFMHCI